MRGWSSKTRPRLMVSSLFFWCSSCSIMGNAVWDSCHIVDAYPHGRLWRRFRRTVKNILTRVAMDKTASGRLLETYWTRRTWLTKPAMRGAGVDPAVRDVPSPKWTFLELVLSEILRYSRVVMRLCDGQDPGVLVVCFSRNQLRAMKLGDIE